METLEITFKGKTKTYYTHDCLTYGSYSGAGSIGAANIESMWDTIKEKEIGYSDCSFEAMTLMSKGVEPYRGSPLYLAPVLEAYGMYNSKQLFVREDCAPLMDLLKKLEDYPCLDEDKLSEIEAERESEAWDNWLCSDLCGFLDPDLYDAYSEGYLDGNVLFELYRKAMDETNTYPIQTYDGIEVELDRIADTFNTLVRQYAIDHNLKLDPEAE